MVLYPSSGQALSRAEGLPGMGELANHLFAAVEAGLSAADIALWEEIKPLIAAQGLEAALLVRARTAEAAISATTGTLIATRERKVVFGIPASESFLFLRCSGSCFNG